ncbi:nitrate/nitrite transporter [Brevundimonas sp.]|uniref:nitrate/nitrite transporter n=1 Tax=Brevundimonas sp. TaxID=1871086 RepID=UPI002FDB7AB3
MVDAQLQAPGANKALWLSTLAFTACFAVWTIFSIIGVQIKAELGLNEAQFGLLVGTPILTGSLIRVFLGVWSDQLGGRIINVVVMLLAAAATFLLSYAETYPQFLAAALGVGIAGGAFAVGVAYVSKFFSVERQGTALGIFGAGNVGSAVTKFAAPFVMLAFGWEAVAQIWAVVLAGLAVLFFLFTSDDPQTVERRRTGQKAQPAWMQLAPLRDIRVWRFSLYYFFVFGAFVALALWLPHYLTGVYGLGIAAAGMLAAAYSIPGSLFRIFGGWLSDRIGARKVMYITFILSVICTFLLAYPATTYVVEGIRGPITFHAEIGLVGFVALIFVLGFAMSLGKAAVFKHIPVYYPNHVGAVGGLVGMIGGLGGFILPILFGVLADFTGVWTSCFMLLFVLVGTALVWMHFSVRRMEVAREPDLARLPAFPELGEPESAHVLNDWRPEDETFWAKTGKRIALRNLTISIPNLLLAFAVWMLWSTVATRLNTVGFQFSTAELFWLTALPALSGATLRIFYSFMVPIVGGRLWTVLTTLSLLIPAVGVGLAVQDLDTPYWVFVLLALSCGLGGGAFASSMSNIGFFFPKREKGNALAMNAGFGNLGVSALQLLAPIAAGFALFGPMGGAPQTAVIEGVQHQVWLQNAGFMWAPLIVLAAIAAWFGMNDVASARASFKEQAVVFKRKHNWLMCYLYIGTFGSFIGFSAAFPLLGRTLFPHIDILHFAFLGPLVGAASRALTGWISDRLGGQHVTQWVFVALMAGVVSVLYGVGALGAEPSFPIFFASFLWLFFWTGVGNASTFQMIPALVRADMPRLMPTATAEERLKSSELESAAIVGFSSAIGAYGGFFIPLAFASSMGATGGPATALYIFLGFYLTCAAVNWVFYARKNSILNPTSNKAA